MSKKIGEIIQRQKKPKIKKTYAPTDINLPSIPFYEIEKKKSSEAETYISADGGLGIGFFRGRPSINAQKWLTYLFSKVPRTKGGAIDSDRLREDGILFTIAELCRFLGQTNQSKNRQRIKEDLVKLGSITLYFHRQYIVKKGGKVGKYRGIENRGLYKVDMYESDNEEGSDQLPLWQSRIRLDDIIINNLENGIFRLIATDDVKKLRQPTAVRIHGIISLHNQSAKWRIGLDKLSEQIPLNTKLQKHKKERVTKALKELKELGTVSDFRFYKNERGEEIIEFIYPQ